MATKDDFVESPVAAVDRSALEELARKITTLPTEHKFFNKTERLFAERRKLAEAGKVDWSMAELMAFGATLQDGNAVRLLDKMSNAERSLSVMPSFESRIRKSNTRR